MASLPVFSLHKTWPGSQGAHMSSLETKYVCLGVIDLEAEA